MIFKFDKTLLKYQWIVFFSKRILGLPEWTYAWYRSAIKVRKEDLMQDQFLKIS